MLQTSLSVNSNVQRWIDVVYNINFTTNTLSLTSAKTTYNVLNQKLQLTLSPTDALNVSFVAEHDLNHYEERNEKNAFFDDISCSYIYRKTEFTLRINNIFNQRYYSSTAYNDLSSSYNKYSLRGRDIIFGAVMYF